MNNRIRQIGIIGLGVIGASLGMALKNKGSDVHVCGRDMDDSVVAKAREMGAVDGFLDGAALGSCDLVIICTPLGAMEKTLLSIKDWLKPGAVVSDVGSVKASIMKAYQELLPGNVYYVGGHPMAGSEQNGISAADKFLLENAAYVLTPPEEFPTDLLTEVTEVIGGTGARVICMSAEEHDRAVARVSHLPHVIASALMNSFCSSPQTLAMAGGSLRDMTRVAGSDPDFWTAVFTANKKALVEEIDRFVSGMYEMRDLINDDAWDEIRMLLDSSRNMKQGMVPARPCLEDSVDVVAIVPDQPGMIGRIGILLGEEQINIQDIHVLSVRDEDEGSLKLTVPRKDGEQACKTLAAHGMISWLRD